MGTSPFYDSATSFNFLNLTDSDLESHLYLCIHRPDPASCALFTNLCILSLLDALSPACLALTHISKTLKDMNTNSPSTVDPLKEPRSATSDPPHQTIRFLVKESSVYGLPLGVFDLSERLSLCERPFRQQIQIGFNLLKRCTINFGLSGSSEISNLDPYGAQNTIFQELFFYDPKTKKLQPLPVFVADQNYAPSDFLKMAFAGKIQSQVKETTRFFYKGLFKHPTDSNQTFLRYLAKLHLIFPVSGVGSLTIERPFLVAEYEDLPFVISDLATQSSQIGQFCFSVNFVTSKSKFWLGLTLVCIFGILILFSVSIAVTCCYKQKISQIIRFAKIQSPSKETSESSKVTPVSLEIREIASKYLNNIAKTQGWELAFFFYHKFAKLVAICYVALGLVVWLIWLVLLKAQNQRFFRIPSHDVFPREYLAEKIIFCLCYTGLFASLILQIRSQAGRKMFLVDWEQPNLVQNKNILSNEESDHGDQLALNVDVDYTETDVPIFPNSESNENDGLVIRDNNGKTGNLANTANEEGGNPFSQNLNNLNTHSGLTSPVSEAEFGLQESSALFDNDDSESEPELYIPSSLDPLPSPKIKKHFNEDLVSVPDPTHPLNQMNSVYQTLLQENKHRSRNPLRGNNTQFPLFINQSSGLANRPAQTSAWRKIMLTNTLNELALKLSLEPLLLLILALALLQGFDLLNWGRLAVKNQLPDQAENHYFLRKFLIIATVLVVAFVYWLARKIAQACAPMDSSDFVDLCSVCNLSLLLQTPTGSFAYLHGKSHCPSGEGDLQTIYHRLLSEGHSAGPTRGLSPESDHQIFEMLPCPRLFSNLSRIRQQAELYLGYLKAKNLKNPTEPSYQKRRSQPGKHVNSPARKVDIRLFELFAGEMESTLKNAVRGGNFIVKKKSTVEKIQYSFEGMDLQISLREAPRKQFGEKQKEPAIESFILLIYQFIY